jgi:hypothetical protein
MLHGLPLSWGAHNVIGLADDSTAANVGLYITQYVKL